MIKQMRLGIVLLFTLGVFNSTAQKLDLIVDTDTGNEMDDLYALTRAVLDTNINMVGVVSAHFNNPQLVTDDMWHIYKTKDINTVGIGQDLNEKLLESLGRIDIPHPVGASKMVGYAWGFYEGAQIPKAAGIDFIIETAKTYSEDRKLNISIFGPATNVAAAILTAPEIIPNIKVYMLGTRYDAITGVWNKNSFNARNDLNALDVLFNTEGLDLIMLPISMVDRFIFEKKKTLEHLENINTENAKILAKRWSEINGGANENWIMWDLALVEAIVNPSFAVLDQRTTPPENTQRNIGVYTKIDEDAMHDDFWKAYKKHGDIE